MTWYNFHVGHACLARSEHIVSKRLSRFTDSEGNCDGWGAFIINISVSYVLLANVKPHHGQHFSRLMVSPPQMPVQFKLMYNANILRAEITTLTTPPPPVWYTIIKPKLSFFKNRSENAMLTSCVSSYAPMLVKKSVLPRSPEIFLRPFPEKTQILLTSCIHPKISQHSIPHVMHEENNVGLQIIHTITKFLYFF